MKALYPEIEPFHTFYLDTDSIHQVYVEQSGNPQGLPVIFLHGGPCSGTRPEHRRFFDPERYRIILFDQRGSGKSIPFGALEANYTQALLGDMERIRKYLNIERWLVFGGSWGGALGLLYAQNFPERVTGMIIRGVFLARQQDLDWFVKDGAVRIFPEQWQKIQECFPYELRDDPIKALVALLWGEDEVSRRRAALLWDSWTSQVALGHDFDPNETGNASQKMLEQVRMELHYAANQYFIENEQVLKNCHLLSDIPIIIIHGRNDLVCPVEAGFTLYKHIPQAEFIVLPQAGHIAQGEEMINALVSASDSMAIMFQNG